MQVSTNHLLADLTFYLSYALLLRTVYHILTLVQSQSL